MIYDFQSDLMMKENIIQEKMGRVSIAIMSSVHQIDFWMYAKEKKNKDFILCFTLL